MMHLSAKSHHRGLDSFWYALRRRCTYNKTRTESLAYRASDRVRATAINHQQPHHKHKTNNLRYTGACFSYGASENSVFVLGLHGERSLGVSFMQMLRKTGEGRGETGTRGRRSSVPRCKVQREAPPRRTINRI